MVFRRLTIATDQICRYIVDKLMKQPGHAASPILPNNDREPGHKTLPTLPNDHREIEQESLRTLHINDRKPGDVEP